MADITKDSFLESNRHTKVVFQRGRDVPDCDLNELQDILRSFMYRQFWSGVQGITLNPAAVDASWKIVQNTGDTANKVKATGQGVGASGYLFCDGIALYMGVDGEEITGEAPDHLFVNNDTDDPRDDGLYLRVTEEEVADPHPFNILGETARRRKLQYSWYVDTRDADPPDSSDPYTDPIWSGGVRYFKMATITRPAHTSEIHNEHILDNRFLLLQEAFSKIVREANHEIQALVAHTLETDQPYQFFDVDLPNARMFNKGCGFVWAAGRDGVGDTGHILGELTSLPASPILEGLFSLNEGYAFGCKNGTRFWDNLLVTDTPPVRLTEGNEVANQLKMLGKYVGGHQGSILRTLNARVGISVGDGINTFGDFNGTNALYDAFMYFMDHIYIAGSITSCVIFVKGGTHNLDADHIITTSEEVQLFFVGEGSQSELCLGNFVQATIQIPNGTLVFRDIKVTASFTDKEAVLARHVQIFTSIFTADVIAHRSALVRDSTLASTLPLQLNIKEYVASGYNTLVDNSNITGTNEILKIVTLNNAGSGGNLVVDNIFISNSRVTSNKFLSVLNHTSNDNKLFLNKISIENCAVEGRSLLAMWATDTTRVNIDLVSVRNTRYTATVDADTTFFVGCTNFTVCPSKIVLENLILVYDNVTMTQPLSNAIKTAVSPAWIADGEWGALTLVADTIKINNVTMHHVAAGSRHADLFIYGCSNLNVNNVNITAVGYHSVYPSTRVWIFPSPKTSSWYGANRVVNALDIALFNPDGNIRYALNGIVKLTGEDITVSNSSVRSVGVGSSPAYVIASGGPVPEGISFDKIKLINNRIEMTGTATGIETTMATKSFTGWEIVDNTVITSAVTCTGISISAAYMGISICRNTFITQSDVTPVYLRVQTSPMRSRIVCSENAAHPQVGGTTSTIVIFTAEYTPMLSMFSNICTYINLQNIHPSPSTPYRDPFMSGLETNYSETGNLPVYNNGGYMLHNNAQLTLS